MSKDRILLSSIYFLFHAGLMAYKLFHPLWFYEQGKLEYFAVGYAFMALGGILSRTYFLFFADVMRISFLLSLSGVMLSSGICVSCIPFHIGYSIVGGLISGFGATTFMSILYRITHMKESKESIIVDVPQVINYSKFIGILVSVVVAYFVATLDSNNLTGILVSSSLALISWMPLLFFKIKHEVYDDIEILHRDPLSLQKVKQMYKQKPYLVLALVALNFLGGACINMSMPYFPVLLKTDSFELINLGILIALSYVFGALAHKVIYKTFDRKFHVKGLFFSSILLMFVALSIGYIHSTWITATFILIFSFLYGCTGLWKKSIEHDIIPRTNIPAYTNFTLTLFHVGNLLGITISQIIISNIGFNITFAVSGGMFLFSSTIGLYFVYKNMEQEYYEYLEKNNGKILE